MIIEKGVPIPEPGAASKYPWARMEVGDMVKVDPKIKYEAGKFAAWYYGKKNGKKFTCRKINGVVHVWRIA